MTPRDSRRLGFRLASILLSLLLVLGGAEAVLRLTQSRVLVEFESELPDGEAIGPLRYRSKDGLRLRPNARVLVKNQPTSGLDVLIETNSLGFRDAELSASKSANERRILAIGDSITFGGHLAAHDVYVEQVEELLQIAEPELQIEVINAGIGDIGLAEAVDLLEGPGLAAQPDALLVGFYLNDSRPPWGFPGELGSPGWLRRHSVLVDSVVRRLALRAWIERTGESRFAWVDALDRLDWRHDREAFHELAALAKYDWGAAWEDDSWTVIARQLDRIAAVASRHSLPVLIVAFPVAYQVYADFVDDGPQLRMAELARERDFAFLDLLPMLRSLSTRKPFYDQCHATPAANRAMARPIARALREAGFSR